MSHTNSFRYNLENSKKQKLTMERVRKRVEEYLEKHIQNIDNIIEEGLNKYISLDNINREIDNIKNIVNTDPFEARNLSYSVGNAIYQLRNIAIDQKKEEERIIKEQKHKNKEEILKYFNSTVRKIDDVILIDFAKDKLDALRNELLNNEGVTDSEIGSYSQDIENRIKNIIDDANASANEWRIKKEKEREKKILESKIEDIEEDLKNEKIETEDNLEKRNKLLENIENVKKNYHQIMKVLRI